MRILVVEDYEPLQTSLEQGLREAGYAVDITGDGQEGLWYAQGNEYDVIILDIMLPNLDGLSILKQLRAANDDTHVLILTAKDTVKAVLNQFDQALKSTAEMLCAVFENEVRSGDHQGERSERNAEHDEHDSGREGRIKFDIRTAQEFSTLHGGGYYQFWNRERHMIVRSPSLGDADLPGLEHADTAIRVYTCPLRNAQARPGHSLSVLH
jgi:CheY-like chemotaxis protein